MRALLILVRFAHVLCADKPADAFGAVAELLKELREIDKEMEEEEEERME
jgi:hypothetical protein